MAAIAILFGVLLTLLGGGLFSYSYFSTGAFQYTAMIPAYFGIALIVLGIIARNEKARMHVMHLAALLGLVGCVFPAYRVIAALVAGGTVNPVAIGGQIAMSVLCGIFLGLCVKSFIDVRIARKQREAQAHVPGQ